MNPRRLLRTLTQLKRVPEVWRAALCTKNWIAFTRNYLFATRTCYPWELRLRSGMRLQMENFHDLVTAWVVFCREEYRVPEGARIIVDIGANYGAFTLFAASRAPNSRILSVEPFPDVFERLERNVAVHSLSCRVRCVRAAVAGSVGLRNMDASGTVSQSRGLLSHDVPAGALVVPVASLTLPRLLQRSLAEGGERIDLVKLDIEGAEHEFLPQLSAEDLSKVDAWQMEYHPNGPSGPIFVALERAGFQCVQDRRTAPNSGVAHFVRTSAVSVHD